MNKVKNTFLIFIALLLSATAVFSQNQKGKARKFIRNADFEMYNNNIAKALELYKQGCALDTTNYSAAYKLAVCMYSIRKYKKQAIPYFEKARNNGMLQADYYLGNLYHLERRYNEAISIFQEYKDKVNKKEFSTSSVDSLITQCRTGIEFESNPADVTIQNIGSTINSEYPDYVPVISADESELIFTSRRAGSTGNLLDPLGDYFEDVYISFKKDSVWSAPRSISSNINTNTHDACVGLSADGELLFLYRTSDDLLSGDLYSSVFDGKDWTVPVKLPSPINSDEYTEPSIAMSPDGQTIYFSSNRPGGFGKKDIYKVIKLPNGEWSRPLNMGPSINTAEDEDALFIHPSGKIFYFSSRGHKNMGGYDIFKSELHEDGVWSEAENLGYPVNSADDDVFFVLSTDGKTGYYSSSKPDTYGGTDIYLVHFPDEDLGLDVFNGVVTMDDSVSQPLAAKITLFDSKMNKLVGVYNTNKLTGKFIMIVNPDREYFMKVESDDCESYVGTVWFSAPGTAKKIKLHRKNK